MLSDFAKIIVPAVVAALISGAMFAVWVANRKRIAADTIGRAEQQAQRLTKDAEREAETTRKEALLDAKEKAHDILMEAERQARSDPLQRAAKLAAVGRDLAGDLHRLVGRAPDRVAVLQANAVG